METVAGTALKLTEWGLAGVMIALVLLCGSTIYMLWKMATNHMEHSNEAFNDNTKALQKLIDLIEYKLK